MVSPARTKRRNTSVKQLRRLHLAREAMTARAASRVFDDAIRYMVHRLQVKGRTNVSDLDLLYPGELVEPGNRMLTPQWQGSIAAGVKYELDWVNEAQPSKGQQSFLQQFDRWSMERQEVKEEDLPSIHVDMSSDMRHQINDWVNLRRVGFWTKVEQKVVRPKLAAILAKSMADGDTLDQKVDRLQKEMTAMQRWAVERIARTETTAAMNYGGHLERADLDIEFKEWMSTIDIRTRTLENSGFDHLHADGMIIENGELFIISGEKLLFPGDSTHGASAGNVVNCRCSSQAAVDLGGKKVKRYIPPQPEPEKTPTPKPPPVVVTPPPPLIPIITPPPVTPPTPGTPPLTPPPAAPPPGVPESRDDRFDRIMLEQLYQERSDTKAVQAAIDAYNTAEKRFFDTAEDIRLKMVAVDSEYSKLTGEVRSLQADLKSWAKIASGAPVDSKEFRDAQAKIIAIGKRFDEIGEVVKLKYQGYAHKRLAEAMGIPENQRAQMTPNSSKTWIQQRENAPIAFDFVNSITRGTKSRNRVIKLFKARDPYTRKYINRSYASLKGVSMGPNRPVKVMVHEVGHVIEMRSTDQFQTLRGFYWKKAGNSDAIPLRKLYPNIGYGGGEIVFADKGILPDRLESAYAMKYYPDATELISLGIEKLYDDPVNFAYFAPEHFRLTVAFLRGDL